MRTFLQRRGEGWKEERLKNHNNKNLLPSEEVWQSKWLLFHWILHRHTQSHQFYPSLHSATRKGKIILEMLIKLKIHNLHENMKYTYRKCKASTSKCH